MADYNVYLDFMVGSLGEPSMTCSVDCGRETERTIWIIILPNHQK